MFDRRELDLLDEALRVLKSAMLTTQASQPGSSELFASLRPILTEAAERLGTSAPYAHPLYLGHMLKPPHVAARLGYALALWLNPNNHAFDGGCASSQMEIEAVAHIGELFGWNHAQGHLCSGGTVANLEALWISREVVREARQACRGGKRLSARRDAAAHSPGIAASEQAHYSHARAAALLGVPFYAVPVDERGRMDLNALQDLLACEDIGTVVATLGTPATGAVDPLHAIVELNPAHGARLHVDAAYGGYFTLANNVQAEVRSAFDAIRSADSLVVDPHKHGLQPYGCGCVLFRDASLRRHYAHAARYAYLASDEPHLGQVSLECSRPGAAAVALWATQRLLPLQAGGAFAQGIEAGRQAALRLWIWLRRDSRFIAPIEPELDVVVWAVRGWSASEASSLARRLHAAALAMDLHVSLAALPRAMLEPLGAIGYWDVDELLVLRACLMKPEHLDWMDGILHRLDAAARAVLGPDLTAVEEPLREPESL